MSYAYINKDDFLMHEGRSKLDGAKVGSGRYRLGSGERPYQHQDTGALSKSARETLANNVREAIGVKAGYTYKRKGLFSKEKVYDSPYTRFDKLTKEIRNKYGVDYAEGLIYSNNKLRLAANQVLKKLADEEMDDETWSSYERKYQMRIAEILGEYGDKEVNRFLADRLMNKTMDISEETFDWDRWSEGKKQKPYKFSSNYSKQKAKTRTANINTALKDPKTNAIITKFVSKAESDGYIGDGELVKLKDNLKKMGYSLDVVNQLGDFASDAMFEGFGPEYIRSKGRR